jgi:hypothetical protein
MLVAIDVQFIIENQEKQETQIDRQLLGFQKHNVVYKRAARTREWRAPPTPYVFEHVVFNNANRYY